MYSSVRSRPTDSFHRSERVQTRSTECPEQQYLAMIKAGNTDYAVFHSTIYDNPYIDKDEIESIIFNTFGEDNLVIFSVPFIPQIGYDFDISSFLNDKEREESFFINTFRVKHITIQKDALVLDIYRV